MRVICVCDEDIRKEGGTKICVVELAQNLLGLGNQVRVIVPGYLPRDTSCHGSYIAYVPAFRKNAISYLLYELLKIPYLIFHILRFRPDVVYAMSGILCPTTQMVGFLLRVPTVVLIHGVAEDEWRMRGFSELAIRALIMNQRLGFWLSSSVVCVTAGIRNEIAKRHGVRADKLHVIPNGANLELFRPLDKHDCRNRLDLASDYFYVGFIGSFAPWQGLETLIRAAKQVRERGYLHIKYLLVGDGELAPTLKKMVDELDMGNTVICAGWVAHQDIVDYINASDIMVAPFSGKGGQALGSPLKLFEYLACGKPVIASRMDGVTEVLEEGHCGYLIEANNVEGLADAIVHSYNEQGELKQLGENGRKLVEATYSWRAITQEVLQTLENAARRKNRTANA